jgi:glutamate formiminotransferase/glutamate formiminotransferase/formiminotetrahydrofolate cyclodeaminase
MTRGLLEAVPNFSEGRDGALLDAIGAAIEGHARVLDVHADADHNRSVFTCVGDPDGLAAGVVAGVEVAVERIDLARHVGVHPRVGAADVLPVVQFDPADPRPRACAEAIAAAVAALGVPVFGYAGLGDGRRPAFFRAGGPERLAERMAAGEVAPIAGPAKLHPRAGAALVGVRAPLVAFNLELETEDAQVARAIAAAVRERDGGLPGLQALGLQLASSGRAQVSMNLIDIDATPLHTVVERVAELARGHGTAIARGELVGLMPGRVAWAVAAHGLHLADRRADRVLETAVAGEFGRT